MTLFGENQPYDQAKRIPCDVVLEILESKLDERFSYLDEDKERLARKELAIVKEYGSVQEMSKLVLSNAIEAPTI